MTQQLTHPVLADINALLRAADTDAVARRIAETLSQRGACDIQVHIADVAAGCEPDNMLVTEWQQRFEAPPIAESLHRILVGATAPESLPDADITQTVAEALPKAPDGSQGLWYGSTRRAELQKADLSIPIACRMN